MKIKVEKSGGFTGMISSNEIDTDELPLSLEGTLRRVLEGKKVLMSKALKRSKGAADYFNYKITIQDGKKDRMIECNEFEMDTGMKSLINYVERKSQKK